MHQTDYVGSFLLDGIWYVAPEINHPMPILSVKEDHPSIGDEMVVQYPTDSNPVDTYPPYQEGWI
jgi:hypothetical protein